MLHDEFLWLRGATHPAGHPPGQARSSPVSRRGLLVGAGALALAGGTAAAITVPLLLRKEERTRWRYGIPDGGAVNRIFASRGG